MGRIIVGMFERRDVAEGALRALIDNGVPADRLAMVAGDARAEAERNKVLGAGEATGAAAAGAVAGLAGLTALAIPAVGTALLAGAAGAFGAAGAQGANEEARAPELHDVLLHAGLSDQQATVYEDDIREGRSLVAIVADERQTDLVHRLLQQHGSSNIEFRRRD
jgi:hypothetical protein